MMTVEDFVRKWTRSSRPEEAAAKEQFLNICSLLDHPQPVDLDPHAENFGLEKRVCISPTSDGFADAWKLGHFVWEYKTKHANLDKAYEQAIKYRPGLRNPPLTVVSDMARFRIYTEFTDTDQHIYQFTLEQLLENEPSEQNRHRKPQEILYSVFYEPDQLRPGEIGTTAPLRTPQYRRWREEQDVSPSYSPMEGDFAAIAFQTRQPLRPAGK